MEAATAEMTVVDRFQLKAFVEAAMLVDEGVATTKDVDLGALERRKRFVEPLLVGAGERTGQDAGAGHHAGLDVLEACHALFEDETRLEECLQAEALDDVAGLLCGCLLHRLLLSACVFVETLAGLLPQVAGLDELPHLG